MPKIRSLLVVAAFGLAATACTQAGSPPAATNVTNQTGSMAYPTPNPAGSITTTTPR